MPPRLRSILKAVCREDFLLFHSIIRVGFACTWGTLVMVWITGLFFTKATARRASYISRLVLFAPLIAFYLLVVFHVIPLDWLLLRLWPQTLAVQAAGLALAILGCGFAIWARLTLGSNWSGLPNVKREHELIVKGPYRLVRHPIYSGLLLALAGTAMASDKSFWTLTLVLIAGSYAVKMRQEEQLMMQTFPDDYPSYRRRVKALIPGVL
jgi:protein-S-isoprenylcysteine O-methyltransferase Ste14